MAYLCLCSGIRFRIFTLSRLRSLGSSTTVGICQPNHLRRRSLITMEAVVTRMQSGFGGLQHLQHRSVLLFSRFIDDQKLQELESEPPRPGLRVDADFRCVFYYLNRPCEDKQKDRPELSPYGRQALSDLRRRI
ncbi:hypothetical protein L596_016981 [Steinernema carpocapsae]|uniref:Uncharacterized protein n=1 Tax=Steinernema carpocapsae TaxID=34508 RepID=A0A4U5N0C8_STECR|nr:hypothetical protein L596_016981 [Steinernema carpocapsae]